MKSMGLEGTLKFLSIAITRDMFAVARHDFRRFTTLAKFFSDDTTFYFKFDLNFI